MEELHGVLSWRPQQRFTAPPEVEGDVYMISFMFVARTCWKAVFYEFYRDLIN